MQRSSQRSHSSGSSACTRTTAFYGRCSSPHRWCRCGTRCGSLRNINGRKTPQEKKMNPTRLKLVVPILAIVAACAIARPPEARAFCGFYVGKADSNLFNHASQVVMVHHYNKTVLSLMNDYQGEPSDFALVVPVPEVLQKEQVHIGDRDVFKKLD